MRYLVRDTIRKNEEREMAKRPTTGKAAPTRRKRSAKEQARILAEAQAALRQLIDRIPRRYAYSDEPALTFDPKQAR